jgi:hypothetical protein
VEPVPYCGSAPVPGELIARFNFDPALIIGLILICGWQLAVLRSRNAAAGTRAAYAFGGWIVAAAAFLSPLCALSVALFSARVAQHMLLILVAAPLIAIGWPRAQPTSRAWLLWTSTVVFFLALWFWHMPVPYEATFTSVWTYWAMHLTLFGSSILLWRELLDHSPRQTGQVLAAGLILSSAARSCGCRASCCFCGPRYARSFVCGRFSSMRGPHEALTAQLSRCRRLAGAIDFAADLVHVGGFDHCVPRHRRLAVARTGANSAR